MPLIDMAREKLRQYNGRNPRPEDLETCWDAAIAEMKQVDSRVELRPAAFQTPAAECFDLYFTGVRDARIHAKLVVFWFAKRLPTEIRVPGTGRGAEACEPFD